MKIVGLIIFTIFFSFSWAQTNTRILFILDASNSMNLDWNEQTRMAAAKEVLSKSLENLRGVPDLELALRVYGHQSMVTNTYQDCQDTKLEVPFAASNIDAIKNKKPEQIFDEIARLVEQGVSEITFIGQNVNSYMMPLNGRMLRLSDLIEISSHIDGVKRIRYTTSHPLDMTDDLIDVYKSVPQLVSQLHLPVQSGSNAILQKMKRNYTTEHFIDVVTRIKKTRPDLRVSSDFIVGFPGETKKDFDLTMELVNLIEFDSSFSFVYSPRPGTPATKLNDPVSLNEKKERLSILQAALNSFHHEHSIQMEGGIERCLVTGIAKKSPDQLQARTECNRVVNFDFTNSDLIGNLIDIKIEKALANSLLGSIHKN